MRAGVCGLGRFGPHHLGKYAAIPGVRLAAVFDIHIDRARAQAQRMGCEAFDDYEGFLDAVDGFSLCTPALSHADFALRALERGKHVYVEKPLATEPADARALVEVARRNAAVLTCGHQERLVCASAGLFSAGEPGRSIRTIRANPKRDRRYRTSVVFELMIHDLDIALALMGPFDRVLDVHGDPDGVQAHVGFLGGGEGWFEARRDADTASRVLTARFPSGDFRLDFANRSMVRPPAPGLAPPAPWPDDPLGALIENFVRVANGEAETLLISPEAAADAVDLAVAIEIKAGLRARSVPGAP